jgi:hypothetical protein
MLSYSILLLNSAKNSYAIIAADFMCASPPPAKLERIEEQCGGSSNSGPNGEKLN